MSNDDPLHDRIGLLLTHAVAALDPAGMLDGLAAPLHPGAKRYYRERGWLPR